MKYCIICKEDEKSFNIKNEIMPKIQFEYANENPDFVIAVGGDGTILKAIHEYPEAIIFGVHTGHLGFFANYGIDDIEVLIDDINNKTYNVEYLDLLSANINGREVCYHALNEVSIITPPRTLILDVYIDDVFFERFRGTGFCISTPFGSTAYNKSLHGSVIDPEIKSLQLTEIAGINSTAYRTFSSPLVLSSKRKIRLEALEEEELFVTVDNISFTENKFKSIEIGYANEKIKFGYHSHQNFLNRIKRTFLLSNN